MQILTKVGVVKRIASRLRCCGGDRREGCIRRCRNESERVLVGFWCAGKYFRGKSL